MASWGTWRSGSFGEWLAIIQDTEAGTETRTHVSSNESFPEAFWELPSIPWSLPQGPSPSILHLDHELMPKVRRKHRPVLGEREREGRAAAPGGLHAKEHPEASAHGPGAHHQGTGRDRVCHTGSPS